MRPLFPEGEYLFQSEAAGGTRDMNASLTHNIPDAPVVISPAEGAWVAPDNVVIEWGPVTSPPGITIAGYQVIVEREDPHREFNLRNLPAETHRVTIAPEFMEAGVEYSFEILAVEVSGNQTITESAFYCSNGPTPTPTPPCEHTGDVNMDGEITADDAQLAFLIALGSISPTYDEFCAADCNGDGSVTAGDAQSIFGAVLGYDSCQDPID